MEYTVLNILCLEDDPYDARLIERTLKKDGIVFKVTRVETQKDFLQELTHNTPDIILADYNLPNFNGMMALALTREINALIPFILVSGTVGEERAIEALKMGANDYLIKDRLSRLGICIRRTLQEVQARKEQERNQKEIAWLASFPERNPLPVIEMDLSGHITYVNPATHMLFPDLTELKLAHPLIHGLDITSIFRHETPISTREVEVNDAFYHETIHFLKDQQRLRFYLVDISERKHLDRIKDEFIGTISHEMRTPLAVIRGAAENLLDDPTAPLLEEQKMYLQMIEKNCDHLAEITNNLVDLTRFKTIGKHKS